VTAAENPFLIFCASCAFLRPETLSFGVQAGPARMRISNALSSDPLAAKRRKRRKKAFAFGLFLRLSGFA
jgi:hypothetical protein